MPRLWGKRINEALVGWRQIGEFEFYFRRRSIVMVRRTNRLAQCVVFHTWHSSRGERALKNFAQALMTSDTMTYDQVFGLATQYDIPSMGTSSSAIPKTNIPLSKTISNSKAKVAQMSLFA